MVLPAEEVGKLSGFSIVGGATPLGRTIGMAIGRVGQKVPVTEHECEDLRVGPEGCRNILSKSLPEVLLGARMHVDCIYVQAASWAVQA